MLGSLARRSCVSLSRAGAPPSPPRRHRACSLVCVSRGPASPAATAPHRGRPANVDGVLQGGGGQEDRAHGHPDSEQSHGKGARCVGEGLSVIASSLAGISGDAGRGQSALGRRSAVMARRSGRHACSAPAVSRQPRCSCCIWCVVLCSGLCRVSQPRQPTLPHTPGLG